MFVNFIRLKGPPDSPVVQKDFRAREDIVEMAFVAALRQVESCQRTRMAEDARGGRTHAQLLPFKHIGSMQLLPLHLRSGIGLLLDEGLNQQRTAHLDRPLLASLGERFPAAIGDGRMGRPREGEMSEEGRDGRLGEGGFGVEKEVDGGLTGDDDGLKGRGEVGEEVDEG